MKAVAALVVAVLAALGWFFLGSGVRFEEAYRALGVVDGGPHALAQALAEDEPPEGLAPGPRLHPPGTLARLRFEQLDEAGTPLASYELRALVPPLPYFGREAPGSELGRIECRARCRELLRNTGAVLIERSGRAGLAAEWVLRLPVGKPVSLGRRDLAVQDIGQESPRSIPHSRVRVTLLEACKATPRIGAETHVQFAPFAPIPIPVGLQTSRWVQLEGCQATMAAAPTAAQLGPAPKPREPAPRLRRAWPDPAPSWEAVRPARSGPLGRLTLSVDEAWLAGNGQPLVFRMLRACRYDPAADRWLALPRPQADGEIALRELPSTAERIAYRFPQENALWFAEWAEIDRAGTGRIHSALVPSGSLTCRDNELPPPAAGEVVACVPTGMTTETRLVPAPEANCDGGSNPAAISRPAPR